jgi:hypothetical protein
MRSKAKKSETEKHSDHDAKALKDGSLRFKIERRAYEIWLSNGSCHGNDLVHWLQAETEVLAGRQDNTRQTLCANALTDTRKVLV